MAHAAETLERAEHTSHAGHGGHGHGGHGDDGGLSTRIGITMAVLGVLLAFTASRVGFERAELVQWLVDQEHAHLKYETQDMKHRIAILTLQQLHASADPSKTQKRRGRHREDGAALAEESKLANVWVHSYDAIVAAHSEAQEEYEHSQLAAELGIVIASIALLLKRRVAWLTAVGLGRLHRHDHRDLAPHRALARRR